MKDVIGSFFHYVHEKTKTKFIINDIQGYITDEIIFGDKIKMLILSDPQVVGYNPWIQKALSEHICKKFCNFKIN